MISLLLLSAVNSPVFQDLDLLDDRVAAISPYAEPVDRRLKLALCPAEPIVAPLVGGVVVVRCPAIGWRIRVPVSGSPAQAARSEILVRKGDLVECMSGGPGFSVSTSMVAMEDARLGEAVRVKSPTSPVAMTATVKARGLVTF